VGKGVIIILVVTYNTARFRSESPDSYIYSRMDDESAKPKEAEPPADEAEAPKDNVEAPKPKRRRKSGWDVPAPVTTVTAAPLPVYAPVPAPSPVLSYTPLPPPYPPPVMAPGASAALSPALAAIAAMDAAAAQRAAYERAQQVLASAGMNMNYGAGVSAMPIAPVKSLENRLYVGSLSYTVSEVEIRTIFGSIGPIRSLDMSFDPATQRSKGYCFVDFENTADAQAAMGMNGVEIAGRPVS
jgi:hypothetical protein